MKTLIRLVPLGALIFSATLPAQESRDAAPVPPPVAQAPVRLPSPEIPRANQGQRVFPPSPDTLVSRQNAEGVLEGFRRVYKTDGAPRIVIYVNRALVDPAPVAREGEKSTPPPPRPAPALADQQTVREVERLFGRAFRHAGAQLSDQTVAATLLPTEPGAHLTGDPAAREREALAKMADIAIEVLISSRSLVIPELGGDAMLNVPDIQATAIRLKDAAIVGQAAASDVIGRGAQAGRAVRRFSMQDITEATALALMEDMLTGRR
ncbi:MAG: hypothetical protein RLZZ221_184 [Verrucomicrobiota bacterium]